MKRICTFILFVGLTLTFTNSIAFTATVNEKTLQHDTSKVSIRKFDAKKMHGYSKESAFIYQNTLPENESLWNKFWRWLWDAIHSAFQNKYSGNILKYIVIGVFVALVIFSIFKIIGLDFKLFSRKSRSVLVPYSESVENIHEINFNEELSRSIAAGNYRLATRLSYLSTLKRLSDKNMINWQPEKTNHVYVTEIEDPDKKQAFSLLTLQFEYIWYGDFSIDQEKFNVVKTSFDLFNGKML